MSGFASKSGRSRVPALAIAALMSLGAASAAKAQTLLGGFQGAGDATDAGWINANNSSPITADPGSSFVAAGVPGYPLSLQETFTGHAAGFGQPSYLELQFSPAQVAAFNANTYLTFTFSVPTGASTAGYNQIYNLDFNAPGIGFTAFESGSSPATTWAVTSQATGSTGNNQSGEPNFYFYAGDPALFSETVTVDYASILPSIIAGGEGYLQLSFQGNTGGGSPSVQDFNDVVLSTQPFGSDAALPEPATMSLVGLASLGLMARRRRSIMGS
jgi:hypothetical protein